MAKYVFSMPTYNIRSITLNRSEREYLSGNLKDCVKDLLSFIKNDSPVCIDPINGDVTIDQLRMYAYKNAFSKSDREIRRDMVMKFISSTPVAIKTYAEERINGLDWDDDEAFRQAVEDITVEYDAHAYLDPETYAPYGILSRHNSSMSITNCGLRKSVNVDEDRSLKDYFFDKDYQKVHSAKAKERYQELVSENTPTKTSNIAMENFKNIYNPWFFNNFADEQER